ncbi:translation initiation factor 1 [Halarchaeum rubridurum]|uniref:Protein translation factor SUI1 homolog n=1 Tax=Halarchaeum rubridurum TaxID=489911 RepID=A0A830FKM0_9EURY|nr:translation initiation factor [Halarchaeum rubridurum]MBP1953994.1 translation initiation factor 1 [Halarchaeum rubridurum]GGM56498.1 stress response translation initiation inhibitor YciH [Halarchaeum rubridurum]
MADDDPFADIPGIEEDLARAEEVLSVRVERRTYDKPVTIVEGFDESSTDLGDVATKLKKNLGAGGTVSDGAVEIQGDHADRVPDLLEEMGFSVE